MLFAGGSDGGFGFAHGALLILGNAITADFSCANELFVADAGFVCISLVMYCEFPSHSGWFPIALRATPKQ
jgi:hypothetical protein